MVKTSRVMSTEQCSACKSRNPSSLGVSLQIKEDYQYLCFNCYNDMMAEHLGIDFENITFSPITLKDTDNREHTFHFQTRLLGYQIIIEAREQMDDDREGYRFSV